MNNWAADEHTQWSENVRIPEDLTFSRFIQWRIKEGPRGPASPPNYTFAPQSPECLTLNSSKNVCFIEIYRAFPFIIVMLVGSLVESMLTDTQ